MTNSTTTSGQTTRAPQSGPPSVHIRAALTWIAIFPLVTIGMLALGPVWGEWHPILRALLLTLIVVPLAVYVVMPQLLRLYATARRRRG